MKTIRTIRTAINRLLPLLAIVALAPVATAATITKANNSDALNLTTSWVGGVVPTSTDIALWDSSVAAGNTTTISGAVSFNGILNTGSQSQNIRGGTLNLGASGITSAMQFHMSGAATAVNLTADQTWALAWGYNSLIWATINNGGFTLTSSPGNAGEPINGISFGAITGSGGFTVAGGGNTHPGTNTYTGTTTLTSGVTFLDAAETAGTSGPLGKSAAANPGSIVFGGGLLRYTAANQNDYSGRFSTAANQAYKVDTAGQTVTWGSDLTSSGGTLTKSGTSSGTDTLILTGANSYTGATTISNGQLQIGNGGTTGTLGSGAVTDNANLTFNRSDTLTVGNAITGSGSLTQAGTGTTILTGANGYTGTTTVSAGTLQNGNGGTTGSFGTGAITNNANITYNHSNIIAMNQMSGTGSVTVNGTNMVWVQSAEAYTGTTTINNGANGLWLGVHNALGSLSGSSTITGSGTLVLSRTDDTTLANTITGGVQLLMNDAGVVTLTGNNSYTGKTVMWSGGMTVSSFNSVAGGTATSSLGAPTTPSNGAIGMGLGSTVTLKYTGSGETTDRILELAGPAGSGAILDQSGTGLLKFTGGVTSSASGIIALTLQGSTAGTGEMGGAIGNSSFATGVTKTGTGTWTLSGANSYSGATTVTLGTLAIGGAGSINASSAVTVAAGAKLAYNSSTALTVAPTLNGAGGGSRATLGGTGTINAAVTLDNLGDTLSPGNSPGIQNFATSQTWNSFTYLWETNNFTGTTAGTDFDQITVTGVLNLTGGSGAYALDLNSLTAANVAGDVANFSEVNRSWTILTASSGITGFNAANWTLSTAAFTSSPAYTGSFSLGQVGNGLVLSYAVVPEPGAWMLLAGAGAGFMAMRRRNQRNQGVPLS